MHHSTWAFPTSKRTLKGHSCLRGGKTPYGARITLLFSSCTEISEKSYILESCIQTRIHTYTTDVWISHSYQSQYGSPRNQHYTYTQDGKARVEFPGRRMLNASTSLLFLPWHCNIPRIRLGVLKLIQSPSQKSSPKQNKRGKNSNSLRGIFSSSSHKWKL